jgi:hypothetical protein
MCAAKYNETGSAGNGSVQGQETPLVCVTLICHVSHCISVFGHGEAQEAAENGESLP